ncbi:hypothetical protein Tco_0802618 [Tanacetum coccineum]|uniref:Integrase, catalytic region, zinc finger, CCHC-type, peptidase aspartic, catalytic n=1 Tax=Tanacetum coccineum TaxID=301880 RepID=A0ABQ5A3A1_9ASTR
MMSRSVIDSDILSESDSNILHIFRIKGQTQSQLWQKQCIYVADNSLNAELAIYKEQVELYERRARFELTEREQKIDEQLRIVICDRNIKEENLKKELHSVKLQLASTIKHNKLMMVDESLHLKKKDFNQKENKYLEEFLDLKALKDKVEDKLFKQGQSIQTVHMMCKPRSYYDEVNKVAIGYKNPLCLHRARQVQPALYSGHVIVTPNHAPAVVRDGEETLELTEISRKKMHDKMKANECVDNKVNITPPDYSKENFLATFTPQKQLTPEQIFWSQDIVKMKAEALIERNHQTRSKRLTVSYKSSFGYGDYVIGDSVISRVYYVEGLGHNLFSVGQFCDSDLEVAFRKHSCYVRDTDGVELLKGSCGSNLYTISIEEMMKSSPICLLTKPPSTNHGYGIGFKPL